MTEGSELIFKFMDHNWMNIILILIRRLPLTWLKDHYGKEKNSLDCSVNCHISLHESEAPKIYRLKYNFLIYLETYPRQQI
jgi:hypothetical protein